MKKLITIVALLSLSVLGFGDGILDFGFKVEGGMFSDQLGGSLADTMESITFDAYTDVSFEMVLAHLLFIGGSIRVPIFLHEQDPSISPITIINYGVNVGFRIGDSVELGMRFNCTAVFSYTSTSTVYIVNVGETGPKDSTHTEFYIQVKKTFTLF